MKYFKHTINGLVHTILPQHTTVEFFFPKICTGKSSKLLVPHFGQKCVAFVCSPKLPITCLKVAVWYSGVLRAPYLSNEFSKLVSIVDTLGSFVSKSAPPENQTNPTNSQFISSHLSTQQNHHISPIPQPRAAHQNRRRRSPGPPRRLRRR